MSFLAPALLALGLSVAVPLVLHLRQRQQGPKVVFPAVRYLRRAEREHATRLRLRQLLLLALRVLALLLLAAAAARPFLTRGGDRHRPTALALVLDHSLSTGAVVGERRVLDELRDAAALSLAAAGPEDRVWLLRSATPWEPAVHGGREALARAVRETEPIAGRGGLPEALARAAALLDLQGEDRAREIHLLTDLQASELEGEAAGPSTPEIPVRVFTPAGDPPPNRAVTAVEVGGGAPLRAGRRSTAAVQVTGADGDSMEVRLVVDGVVRAAGTARTGGTLLLPFPALPEGRVRGHVEIRPDALRADDRRHFVVDVAPPLSVGLAAPAPFLEEALAVLDADDRIRRVDADSAELVVAPGARGAEAVTRGAAVVVLPPASPLELPAANQRLERAGIPWRIGPSRPGEARLDTAGTERAVPLADVRLRRVHALERRAGADSAVLRLRDGTPWAVAGRHPTGGRYLVLASPLTPEGGTLATTAAMVPFLDRWLLAPSDVGARAERHPGEVITVTGDAVSGPAGTDSVARGSTYRLREPGIYEVLRDGAPAVAYAVNPAPAESRLARLGPDDARERVAGAGAGDVVAAGAPGWADVIFHDRVGRELTRWLLAAALLFLVLESAVAATGRQRRAAAATRGAAAATPAGSER